MCLVSNPGNLTLCAILLSTELFEFPLLFPDLEQLRSSGCSPAFSVSCILSCWKFLATLAMYQLAGSRPGPYRGRWGAAGLPAGLPERAATAANAAMDVTLSMVVMPPAGFRWWWLLLRPATGVDAVREGEISLSLWLSVVSESELRGLWN